MGGFGNLVELFNATGAVPFATVGGALACGGLVAFAWRGWAPPSNALPPLGGSLPPSVSESELARAQVPAQADAGLLGVSVPGGGE